MSNQYLTIKEMDLLIVQSISSLSDMHGREYDWQCRFLNTLKVIKSAMNDKNGVYGIASGSPGGN